MGVQQRVVQFCKWSLEDRLRHATMVFCGYAKDVLELIEQLLLFNFNDVKRDQWLDGFQTLKKNIATLDQVADYDEEKYFQLMKEIRNEGASLHLLNDLQRTYQHFTFTMGREELTPLLEPFEALLRHIDLSIKDTEYFDNIQRFSRKPIEIVDQFDYFVDSIQQATAQSPMTEQLLLIISQLVLQLAHFDVYELDVYNRPLDGEKMISIGTVPNEQAPTVEKYHVCKVFERGFYIKETNVILREARVMTVL